MNPRDFTAIMLLLQVSWVALCTEPLHAQSQIEITFQSFEVDVGQDADDAPIQGDEWNAFGIDMVGSDLRVYTTHDPFAAPDNRNGVFHLSGSFWDIVFEEEVEELHVRWWTAIGPVILTSFDIDDVQLESKTHGVGIFGTDGFTGAVKRLRIEAEPPDVGIANLQFVPSSDVGVSSRMWSAIKQIYRK
jgi:hypothetical protein